MNKYHFFWGGEFSQWYKSPFTDPISEITFNCCEQYMMFCKATLFNDLEIAEQILKTKDPREQKALGRKIKNFDPKVWNDKAKDIVRYGNYLKFTQNKELKELLLSIDAKEFVEASPVDNVWGIGLHAEEHDAQDKTKWRGTNWLGECITVVRDLLRRKP